MVRNNQMSIDITNVGYNKAYEILEVSFRNGAPYQWKHFPQEVLDNFTQSIAPKVF